MTWVRYAIAPAPSSMPVAIRTRGPSRGKATMLARLELIRMQPIIGRNDQPGGQRALSLDDL